MANKVSSGWSQQGNWAKRTYAEELVKDHPKCAFSRRLKWSTISRSELEGVDTEPTEVDLAKGSSNVTLTNVVTTSVTTSGKTYKMSLGQAGSPYELCPVPLLE